jgi:hypothetical protein
MFLVAKYNSSTAWGGFAYGKGLANQCFGLAVRPGSGVLVLQGWGSGNDLTSTAPGLGAGWLTQAAVLQSGTATLFKNGQQAAQWSHTYNTVHSRIVVGQEIASLGYIGMDVACILVYNRALNSSERQAVETYLRAKYFGS